MRSPDSFARRCAPVVVASIAALVCASFAAAQEADPDAPIRYVLRAGEDPSRVARMFNVPLEELLARNGIRDASRLAVGTVLEIPDPRATRVQELRAELDELRARVETLTAEAAASRERADRLAAELETVRSERDALESRLTLYEALRVFALIMLGVAVLLAAALLVVVARVRDEARRRIATLKHTEALRAAVERYRGLAGQLELKYHNLYRQLPADGEGLAAATKALREAYDMERADVEADVARSEAALDALDKPSRARRKRHAA